MNREKFRDKCDLIIRLAFYALIYFLPISIALTETFAGIACVTWFVKRGFDFSWVLKDTPKSEKTFKFVSLQFLGIFKPLYKPLNWPLAIFILANGLSAIFSQYPHLSIPAFFAKILQQTWVYVTFIEAFKNRKQLRTFVTVYLISAILASVNGIFQGSTGVGFLRGRSPLHSRIESSFGHPNDFGSYLLPVFFISIVFLLFWYYTKNRHSIKEPPFPAKKNLILSRLFIMVVFVLVFFNLGATFSRGAWVGILGGAAFIFYYDWRKGIPLALCVIMFFSIFTYHMKIIRNVSLVSDDVALEQEQEKKIVLAEKQALRKAQTTQADVSVDIPKGEVKNKAKDKVTEKKDVKEKSKTKEGVLSFQKRKFERFLARIKNFGGMGRSMFWLEALYITYKHPVFGCGLNTYSFYGKDRQLNWGAYPHNCFLQMMAELGIFGILSFIWFFTRFFKGAIKSLREIENIFLKCLMLGCISGAIGFFCHSALDTNLYTVQLSNYIWVIVGIVVAIQRLPKSELLTK